MSHLLITSLHLAKIVNSDVVLASAGMCIASHKLE